MPDSRSAPQSQEVVYVIDDDESVRLATCALLASVRVATRAFGSATEFLAATRPLAPSCIVVDVRMPDLGGIDLIERLRAAGDLTPAVVMTGFGDVPTTVRAFRSGATDFLEKPAPPQALIDAVQRLLRADAERVEGLRARADVAARIEQLTPREREVLRLVVAGETNKSIGAELSISVKTVEIHRKRVMEKLRAPSLAALVTMVLSATQADDERA